MALSKGEKTAFKERMEEKSSKGKGEATHCKEENQVSLKSSLQGQMLQISQGSLTFNKRLRQSGQEVSGIEEVERKRKAEVKEDEKQVNFGTHLK